MRALTHPVCIPERNGPQRLPPRARARLRAPLTGEGEDGIAALALRDPVGFAVYGVVLLMVRSRKASTHWIRGR